MLLIVYSVQYKIGNMKTCIALVSLRYLSVSTHLSGFATHIQQTLVVNGDNSCFYMKYLMNDLSFEYS